MDTLPATLRNYGDAKLPRAGPAAEVSNRSEGNLRDSIMMIRLLVMVTFPAYGGGKVAYPQRCLIGNLPVLGIPRRAK